MAQKEKTKNPDNTGDYRDDKGRFRQGVSGNPNGKPPGSISVVAELKKKLEEIPKEGNPEKKRYLDMLVLKVIKKALAEGDVSMIKDIIDRIDGRPKQPTEFSGSVYLNKISPEEQEKIDNALDEII